MSYTLRRRLRFVSLLRVSGCLRQTALLLLAGFVLTGGNVVHAQSGATGTIVGTVTDSSGAAIPDATVLITNVGTNTRQRTVTSATGTYSAPSLLPGSYQVSVNKDGFSKQVVGAIKLAVGKEVTIDISLRPGTVSDSVNVEASGVALDTENAAVGQVISGPQVVDLPLNGRNFTQLLLLGAGATENSGEQGGFRANEGNAFDIQGGRPDSNQYALDGININDVYYATPAVVPSIDAVQEFQEQTKGYSAAYGGGANQINLTTKSGTNELHGTVYEFFRNNALDAIGYVFHYPAPPTPTLRQNQFGYSLGGPVWIPKLYNGKNRTFFFANYEGLRIKSSYNGYALVPTTAELNGVFTTTVKDPATGAPFPNNTIPKGDFSQFAISAIPHFPTPNVNAAQGNYQYTVQAPQTSDQQTYRVDQYLGDKNKFFARYTQTDYNEAQPGLLPEGTSYQNQPTRQVVGSYTRIFTPTLVNQARFGWMREVVTLAGTPIPESEWNGIGLKGLFPYNQYTTYPQVSVLGYSGVGGPGYAPQSYDQPNYQFSDALFWSKRNHNISLGMDFIHLESSVNNFSSPKFSFDGTITGNPVADFLLGITSEAQAQQPTQFATSPSNANAQDLLVSHIAPWVQDDWKVSPRLTINLGVRWDFTPLPYESRNDLFWLDRNIPGGGLYTANKQIIQDGIGGQLYQYGGSSPGPQQWKVFAPRVGLAFRPFTNGKTVLRAGWGIFYDSSEIKESFAGGEYPFAEQSTFYYVPISTMFPAAASLSPVTSADLGFVWAEDKYVPPYVSEWTASVEREVWSGVKVEADYLGSEAHHLTGRTWENAPYPDNPLNPTPVSARLPYPNLGTMLGHPFEFYSNYNAMVVKAERQGPSLTLLASYTWSHSLDDKSSDAGINGDTSGNGPMDQYNWRLDYASSSFDITNVFVGSFIYQLPFGRGKALLGNVNRGLNLLVGGWQVNGILSLESGLPYSIAGFDVGFENQNSGQRANIVGNPYPAGFHRSVNEWFNTAAFANPGLGQFGTSGRDLLRAPGHENVDLSIFKTIPLGERVKWQTRGEFFNAFNHTNFQGPSNADYASNFGVIGSAAPGRIVQLAMKLIW